MNICEFGKPHTSFENVVAVARGPTTELATLANLVVPVIGFVTSMV